MPLPFADAGLRVIILICFIGAADAAVPLPSARCLLCSGICPMDVTRPTPSRPLSLAISFAWLEAKTRWLLQHCQLPAVNDTAILFTPDASASYGAQWTRDFAMALAHSSPGSFPALPPATSLAASLAFTLSRITASGWVPDRVTADGEAVFAPGKPGMWPIQLAWDNM